MTTYPYSLDTERELGFEKIDSEHSKFFDMLNHVNELLSGGKSKRARNYFHDILSDYVYEHFRNEERFMESFRFPCLEVHKRSHLKFRKTVEKMKPLIETYDDVSFRQALSDIFVWVSAHIGRVDRQYIEYYFEKSLVEKHKSALLIN